MRSIDFRPICLLPGKLAVKMFGNRARAGKDGDNMRMKWSHSTGCAGALGPIPGHEAYLWVARIDEAVEPEAAFDCRTALPRYAGLLNPLLGAASR